MIERIVLVKLTEDEIQRRSEIADHSRGVLRLIPGVEDVHVGLPADEPSAAAWEPVSARYFTIGCPES